MVYPLNVIERLRHLPPLVYLFLAISTIGVIVEVTYHFMPPEAIPAYSQWLSSLAPADKDFFLLSYELVAHACVALGLFGMVAVYIYQQLDNSQPK